MTVSQCLNGCSELGYKHAGLKSGNQCMCGDVFNGGIKLPYSQCQTPCTGNSTQTCGGDNRIELFNTTAATVTPATQRAARPVGYLGTCFIRRLQSVADLTRLLRGQRHYTCLDRLQVQLQLHDQHALQDCLRRAQVHLFRSREHSKCVSEGKTHS